MKTARGRAAVVVTVAAAMMLSLGLQPATAAPIDGVVPGSEQAHQGFSNEAGGVGSLGRSAGMAAGADGVAKAKPVTQGTTLADTDRFIVAFKQPQASEGEKQVALDAAERATALEGVEVLRERADGTTLVQNRKDLTPAQQREVIKTLEAHPAVESVEADLVVENGAAATPYPSTPNDPYYRGYQWNMRQINASGAWPYATGKGVVIGVADTGSTFHPDLSAKWLQGYDFLSDTYHSKDGNGRDSNPQDVGDDVKGPGVHSWHGTHVAGIAAASTNNRMGVAGVAPDAKIVMARNMGRNGRGYVSDYADSLMWLAGIRIPGVPNNANPAKVVNFSEAFTSATCPAVLKRAIDANHARNVPTVVSAGNAAVNTAGVAPANCLGAIVVAATSSNGGITGYSNWGALVDVAAPGGTVGADVWSTVNSGVSTLGSPTYGPLNGTSMAAPHVAGIVAEMKQRNPNITVEQVRTILRNTGGNAGGYKLVNAQRAVSQTAVPVKYSVVGEIRKHYLAQGGAAKLGQPLMNQRKVGDGYYQNFSKGAAIYWSSYGGGKTMWESKIITGKFRSLGSATGIGFPTSTPITTPTKHKSVYQQFDQRWTNKRVSRIYYDSTSGRAFHIRYNTAIGKKWVANKAHLGYGIPISDEKVITGGTTQSFRSLDGTGRITVLQWKSATGVVTAKRA